MNTTRMKLFLIVLLMSLPMSVFANDRLVAHKPSHSQSALPCGLCHLRTLPELMPKLKRVNNVVYLDECGSCHLAYQPEWLPKRSWKKLIAGLNDHFGEEIELSKTRVKILKRYVMKNAADRSKAARSKMVMKTLGPNDAPIRIMDIPYIKEKHKGIAANVIARKSVRSLANCESCHISAHGGMYIPKHINVPSK